MAVAPVLALPAGPSDTLEVRWIVAGPPAAAVLDWFGRFPARTQTREDRYLLWPGLPGLSVKLRGDRSLDVKAYLGNYGVMAVPGGGQGRLERWRKWSLPLTPARPSGAAAEGWVLVRKQRHLTWFPLPAAPGTGCAAELTEAQASGQTWWSVGLEAAGTPGLLRAAVLHAAGLLFAVPLPAAEKLSLDNSRSYAQWLDQQPGQHPGGLPGELPRGRPGRCRARVADQGVPLTTSAGTTTCLSMATCGSVCPEIGLSLVAGWLRVGRRAEPSGGRGARAPGNGAGAGLAAACRVAGLPPCGRGRPPLGANR